MKKRPALHWQIIIGILLGVVFGAILIQFDQGSRFIINWIKPWGTIFINLLKLIAIPLIITSLLKGISDLRNVTNLSRMGGKTFIIYILTTLIAVVVGLATVNITNPGKVVSEETRTKLLANFETAAESKVSEAHHAVSGGPLQPLVDIVPENFFFAISENTNMLQVIFFTILFGVGMVLLPNDKTGVVKAFFDQANDIILRIIDIIMKAAPYGVFALIAALVAESPSADIFVALGAYGLTVIAGLAILLYLIYPVIIKFIGKRSPREFMRHMMPAKLVAFSTSSSAATLPVTMECVEEGLKINKEVSNFTVPVGATINMDGTTLYQAVAAVFIAQVMGFDLTFADQLTIVLTASLAGIGAAAVPGAGILMLVIVLESIGVNPAGIALIFAIDRPLDMCRTVVNVVSDGMVAILVERLTGYKKAEGTGTDLPEAIA